MQISDRLRKMQGRSPLQFSAEGHGQHGRGPMLDSEADLEQHGRGPMLAPEESFNATQIRHGRNNMPKQYISPDTVQSLGQDPQRHKKSKIQQPMAAHEQLKAKLLQMEQQGMLRRVHATVAQEFGWTKVRGQPKKDGVEIRLIAQAIQTKACTPNASGWKHSRIYAY